MGQSNIFEKIEEYKEIEISGAADTTSTKSNNIGQIINTNITLPEQFHLFDLIKLPDRDVILDFLKAGWIEITLELLACFIVVQLFVNETIFKFLWFFALYGLLTFSLIIRRKLKI